MIDIQAIASSSAGNAYRITDGYTALLLECGILWKKLQVALQFKTSALAGCLLTHNHFDHSRAARNVLQAGIDLYCSKGTSDALGLSGHRVLQAKADMQFNIGSWRVRPFEAIHDGEEPLGFLLANSAGEKLLFLTDSSYCRPTFEGLTHIMIEANFSQAILDRNVERGKMDGARRTRVMENHFSLERVKDLLQANDLSKLQQITLLHLSAENSDEEMFRSEIQQLTGIPVTIA